MSSERSLEDGFPNIVKSKEPKSPMNQTSQTEESSENGASSATQMLPEKMATDSFIYREDVVSCSKCKDLLGVVLEVAGDSDSDGSITDDSDSEDNDDENIENNDADGNEGGDNHNGNDAGGDDDNDSLPEGQARIVWTDGSETTNNINDILLIDRSFVHGDMISSATNPMAQLGLIVDVNITVDLLASNGETIKNISSKDLIRIQKFTAGDYVINGPWLGRVDDVLDNVTILFDDGSICKVVKADPLKLQPVNKPIIDDGNCPYYPGQRIKAVSSSVFKSSKWLSGLWRANRVEGTVIKVETASVVVYWIASAHLGIGTNSSSVPSEEQNPKDLILLDCFSHANWQLCDFCLLPSSYDAGKSSKSNKTTNGHQSTNNPNCLLVDIVDETEKNDSQDCSSKVHGETTISEGSKHNDVMVLDSVNQGENIVAESNGKMPDGEFRGSLSPSVSKEASTLESWPSYRRKARKVFFKREKKSRRKDESFERAFFITKTVTKVDVVWQDGTKEFGLDSKSLIPIRTPNDHEFFPNQYVVEKPSEDEDYSGASQTKRVGIVKSLNAKEKTVIVKWFKPVSRPEDPRVFDCDEVVSVYELDEHPDYDYCYGDVVVRLSPLSDADNIMNMEPEDESEQSSKDKTLENFNSLSWVGNITGLQDGDIEVTWADGMVSKVGPQAIFVVGRDDDGDSFEGGSEVSDDGASWETVDEIDMNTHLDVEEEADSNNLTENDVNIENISQSSLEDEIQGQNSPLSLSLAAFDFVARFATGLFSLGRKQSDFDNKDANGSGSNDNEEASREELGLVNQDALIESQNGPDEAEDAKLFGADIDHSMPIGDDNHYSFKHFDIVQNPLDHYYLDSNTQSTGGKKWVKKVQQEWSILEKNLPDDIFVRVYEDRMDLLRAVIIGAAGTPYQDGLFFFDFQLPSEYPQVPPSAYYHSGGLRVNPNLYVDGKVCLSLLNTWTGKGNEVWDPTSSSILQVLVSLQGLVLNSTPYFNEAGYDKQVGTVEGEKNSLPYNENAYLLNLKSMMYHLRRPPAHFEGFTKDHFCQRGHYILKACEAYMGNCMIGSLTKHAFMTEKSKEHSCSTGFKLMLIKILPRLISAFKEVGVDCQQFEHLQNSEGLSRN